MVKITLCSRHGDSYASIMLYVSTYRRMLELFSKLHVFFTLDKLFKIRYKLIGNVVPWKIKLLNHLQKKL